MSSTYSAPGLFLCQRTLIRFCRLGFCLLTRLGQKVFDVEDEVFGDDVTLLLDQGVFGRQLFRDGHCGAGKRVALVGAIVKAVVEGLKRKR